MNESRMTLCADCHCRIPPAFNATSMHRSGAMVVARADREESGQTISYKLIRINASPTACGMIYFRQLDPRDRPHAVGRRSMEATMQRSATKAPFVERRRGAPRIVFDPPLKARYMGIDGTWTRPCLVIDTSQTGAQLEVSEPVSDLREFFLILSPSSPPVFRRCRLIWINGNRTGVEFQKDK